MILDQSPAEPPEPMAIASEVIIFASQSSKTASRTGLDANPRRTSSTTITDRFKNLSHSSFSCKFPALQSRLNFPTDLDDRYCLYDYPVDHFYLIITRVFCRRHREQSILLVRSSPHYDILASCLCPSPSYGFWITPITTCECGGPIGG
jgi:hypothetical protein